MVDDYVVYDNVGVITMQTMQVMIMMTMMIGDDDDDDDDACKL